MIARFRALYGSSPLHLLALLASFALAAAAAVKVGDDPLKVRYALWFIGAIVAHDLLLFPLYALLDRSAGALVRRRRRGSPGDVNFVRVPLLLSGLLLLVYGSNILQRSEAVFGSRSGLDQDVFLGRWLAISGVLLLISAVLYALRGRRSSPAPA